MRQKAAVKVTGVIVVALSGMLILFACGRKGAESTGGKAPTEREPAAEPGYLEGKAEKHEQETHGSEETGALEPSGTLQEGLRVVESRRGSSNSRPPPSS